MAGFQRRIESLSARIEALPSLRRVLGLEKAHDLTEKQWALITPLLVGLERRMQARLQECANRNRRYGLGLEDRRQLNERLGELELELARAFSLFDTYMDILTQRNTTLGGLLRGCDVLADSALRRDHPILSLAAPPIVHCDRGFGASVLRSGAMLESINNPTPLVQIPYSRLCDKLHLSSVVHEVAHEALVLLKLTGPLKHAIRAALARAGAPNEIQTLYALWVSELGPDFWAFCASGIAQTAGLREVLALPAEQVFHISVLDQHPPPYLRVLVCLDWCEEVWGDGPWRGWRQQWLDLYPLSAVARWTRDLVIAAARFIPVVTRMMLRTRYRVLQGRPLPSLFDIDSLAPRALERASASGSSAGFGGLEPSAQLAVFRWMHERRRVNAGHLDNLMTTWLRTLGARGSNYASGPIGKVI